MLYVWYISIRTFEAHLSLCPWPVQWVQPYQQQCSPAPVRRSSGGWTVAHCRWYLWRWGTPTRKWTDWDCPCPRQVWSGKRGDSVKIMNTFLIHYPVLSCFRPKPINLVSFITVHPHIYMCIYHQCDERYQWLCKNHKTHRIFTFLLVSYPNFPINFIKFFTCKYKKFFIMCILTAFIEQNFIWHQAVGLTHFIQMYPDIHLCRITVVTLHSLRHELHKLYELGTLREWYYR